MINLYHITIKMAEFNLTAELNDRHLMSTSMTGPTIREGETYGPDC